jgi:DNA-binding winged helix-turn-helix (wHTH) protein
VVRDFVLDVAAYELRRNGHPVRFERQPMDLLILLVGRRGQLVSRSQIVDALWGKDVFVDVENGVNTAIRKLRQALRDSPDAPTFIETVPGTGYRFIATVEVLPDVVPSALSPAAAPPSVGVGVQAVAARAETGNRGVRGCSDQQFVGAHERPVRHHPARAPHGGHVFGDRMPPCS